MFKKIKTLSHFKIILIISLLHSSTIFSQDIKNKIDSTLSKGDTVMLIINQSFHGVLQWQICNANQTWTNIEGENNDTLLFIADISAKYRALITEGTCNPVYSDSIQLTVFETSTVTDYDGNIYKTIKIGNQWWMAENLKTTHYSDGTPIPLIDNANDWDTLGNLGKAMCFYNDTINYADSYGALYTWTAAMNGETVVSNNGNNTQGACPDGWHIPGDWIDWKTLEIYLGMSQAEADNDDWRGTNEGSKLAGNSEIWADGPLVYDTVAFGTSGFSALPGGYRNDNGQFFGMGNSIFFWTNSNSYIESLAWHRRLWSSYSKVRRSRWTRSSGFSVRCIQD